MPHEYGKDVSTFDDLFEGLPTDANASGINSLLQAQALADTYSMFTAPDPFSAALTGNAGVAVGPPVMTIGERNAFIKSAVDLILASNRTEAEKTQSIADIAISNNINLSEFSEISGLPAFVISHAAITHNVTFPGVTPPPPPPPPTLAETIETTVGGIWEMMEIDPNDYDDDDELLELYGYALEALNEAKSAPIDSTYNRERRTKAEDYFEQVKAAISSRDLEIPTGTFTQNVTAAGRTVGGWMDRIFDFLGIRKPDYAVVQAGPGGTLIWGKPQHGGVFSRVGTTPGGTIVGVQTGIPALDRILSNTADILTGRVEAGEVFNAETIEQAVLDAAGDVLGVDAGTITVAGIKEAVTTVVDAVSVASTEGTQVTIGAAAAGTLLEDKATTTGADTVVAAGADTVTTGADTVTTGADTVTTGADTVTTGADTVTTGADTVTTGADTVTTGADTLVGTTGADTLVGTTGADTVTTTTGATAVIPVEKVTTAVTPVEVATPDPIILGDQLREIVLGAEVSQKEKVGGQQARIDTPGDVDPNIQTGDEISAVNVGGDVSGDQIGGDVLGTGVGGDVSGDQIGGDVLGTGVGGDVSGDQIGGALYFAGAGGEQAPVDVGAGDRALNIGDKVSAVNIGDKVSAVNVGGGDYALYSGGEQAPVDVGAGDKAIVVGDKLHDLVTDRAAGPLETGGGERALYTDRAAGPLETGGSDRALETGGASPSGGGGFGFGDSGLRGYRDDPGDLVGDFPLVSPYGEYTMEEMMAELDRIIGTAKNSEKNT